MNILLSYNWLKEHLDTKLSVEEFAKITTNAGNSVERTDYLSKKFDGMVVGVIDEVLTHPDADKLKVVKTNIGTKKVDIVCGGANLSEGMKVAVGLPGAYVRWHGEGELVELKETKIRGVKSHGMICAASEIGFEVFQKNEKDIWDISEVTNAKAGTSLAKALEIDDVVFDIEVTSNRPDCKSVIGQARDAGAATKDAFIFKPSKLKEGKGEFKVSVKEPELCPKYSAVRIEGVKVGPSPWWLQKKLIFAGFKPISNVVDVTNLLLHEYGQPLHVFDASKIAGKELIIRKAKAKEKFSALDDNEYELTSDMLVIADKKKAVAVAGVMGGKHSGASEDTTEVIIECATFDPVSVRRTARALNLYSDSQLLFEKGLSTEATKPALARAIELIEELTGGHVASKVTTVEAKKYHPLAFGFDPKKAVALMGTELKEKEMTDILERLGFELKESKGKYDVTVPYWRDHDIEASVDFVEEIARIHGYDKFPSQLPDGVLPGNSEDPSLVWQRRVKEFLAGLGLTETYSYSFVSEKELQGYGIAPKSTLKLKNPLSEDQSYFRTSLAPSMLTTIRLNQTRFAQADLFELAPVYHPKKDSVPNQELSLLVSVYGSDSHELFLRAKGILSELMRYVGMSEFSLDRKVDEKRWHKGRSASIVVNKKTVGIIGQISGNVKDSFSIDPGVVMIELDFQSLLKTMTLTKSYNELPQFPAVKRDLAFVVQERVEYADLEKALHKISDLVDAVELFDVYRGKGVDKGSKSVAVHLSFRSDDKTLEAKQVDDLIENMRTVLQKEFGAVLRS